MFRIIKERLKQKYRTVNYPIVAPTLPENYIGVPSICKVDCSNCNACIKACPTKALSHHPNKISVQLDMGYCIFCAACQKACPKKAISFSKDHRVASFNRENLIIDAENPFKGLGNPKKDMSLFRKSLKLREVSAGGCNACEADTNVLGTLVYDLGRFGISFVASPRHADGIVVTGPVSKNMHLALLDTYNAASDPRIIIAVGSCAISGGLFSDSLECLKGASSLLPVDLFIPGCPPSPWSILDALLAISKRNMLN